MARLYSIAKNLTGTEAGFVKFRTLLTTIRRGQDVTPLGDANHLGNVSFKLGTNGIECTYSDSPELDQNSSVVLAATVISAVKALHEMESSMPMISRKLTMPLRKNTRPIKRDSMPTNSGLGKKLKKESSTHTKVEPAAHPSEDRVATGEDVLRMLCDIDAVSIAYILLLRPTLTELEEAVTWSQGDAYLLGRRPLTGKAAQIFNIISSQNDES